MDDHDRGEIPGGDPDRARTVVPKRSWVGAGTAAALVALACGALWSASTGVGPAVADAGALRDAIVVREPPLTTAALVVTTIGNTVAMALVALVVGVWLWTRGRRGDATFLIATMATASLAFRGLKLWLDRPRPPLATRLVQETNESLPSGHATMSITVVGSLVLLSWAGTAARVRALVLAAAVLWVGTVGATRVYLGVHWLSDVLAGWAVGAAWLTLCALVWARRRERVGGGA